MERENIDFYEKVRVGYLVLAKGMPERFIVIDGTKSEDAIENQIWAELEKRLFKPAAISRAAAKPKAKAASSSKRSLKKAPAKARSKKAGKR
jgi:dTMP kinase